MHVLVHAPGTSFLRIRCVLFLLALLLIVLEELLNVLFLFEEPVFVRELLEMQRLFPEDQRG
jgi:hypothetical protein